MTRPLPRDLPDPRPLTRRRAIGLGAGALAAAAVGLGPVTGCAASAGRSPRPGDLIGKAIPASGEEIPVIGMGTWQTFMVEETEAELAPLREVLRSFHEMGGRAVDSSPMYGNAEKVTGDLAGQLGLVDDLWVATKVWTQGAAEGRAQMEQSMSELRRRNIELMQVHNDDCQSGPRDISLIYDKQNAKGGSGAGLLVGALAGGEAAEGLPLRRG